ncbi:hypothetical protein QQZ08_004452 [Neonectria magnoliae]|uniref:Uncharacterized protein n=1 Tax=Neonectria magnoliae TaxID=2732573 RepID=A0ABR1I679_9HYPO
MSLLKVFHIRQPKTDHRQLSGLVVNEGAWSSHDDYVDDSADDSALDTPEASGFGNSPFDSLAKWAFGPEEPASLEAIAYGDFVDQCQEGQECFILCPGLEGGGGFQFLTTDSAEWKDVLRQYGDMLEASSSQPLFEWDDA